MNCCFIIPYFGKLPSEFPVFLKTCQYNKGFDWLIYTDDRTEYDYPDNVHVKYISFESFRMMAAQKFDFEISLENPYKLCDYKPAYGYICEEDITNYDFWGHTDIDVVLGKLDNFITEDLLENYDKLFCLGHFVLYRNNQENNRVFMSEHCGESLFRRVFSTPEICWFDEEWKDKNNINQIFLKKGKKVYCSDYSANISIKTQRFNRIKFVIDLSTDNTEYINEKFGKTLYVWDNGQLFRFYVKNRELIRDEFMYLHYQQRHMKYSPEILKENTFKIVPNAFLKCGKDIKSTKDFMFTRKSSFSTYGLKRLLKFFGYKYDGLRRRLRELI